MTGPRLRRGRLHVPPGSPPAAPAAGRSCHSGRAAPGWSRRGMTGSARRPAPWRSPSRPDRAPKAGRRPCGRDCPGGAPCVCSGQVGWASALWTVAGRKLSGVLGGLLSLASSSARRCSAVCTRCHSASISASFSAWLSPERFGSGGTRSLNRVVRDRVKHFLRAGRPAIPYPSRR